MPIPTASIPAQANVSFMRDEVRAQLSKWSLVRDCLEGQSKIKAEKAKYLPKPNAEDISKENEARYTSYLERAVFYNVTRRTLDGLVGQVFMRDPVITDLSEPLQKILLVDTDGAGVGLNEQAKKTLADTMSFGRVGLLVDFPKADRALTKAEMEKGFVRPTIVIYQPEQIINWRTKTVGGRKLLSLVVLVELYAVEDDGFEPKTELQWRVLRLIAGEKGQLQYVVELWRETTSSDGAGAKTSIATLAESFVPRDSAGQPFGEIPFTIIGAINNDPTVDPAPLFDLGVLNIGHYRNSADYEEACFIVGQPTVWAAGLTEHWVSEVLKGEVQLGSRALLSLPEGGTAGLIQVSPNSMPKEAMEQKERQMVALGARLVEQRTVQRTFGEAQQEESGETSILASVAKNVSAAYTYALNWCLKFSGGQEKPAKYELNTDFIAAKMSSEDRAQLVAEWQAGAIGYAEMRRQLRRAGVATDKDDDVKSEAESDPLRQGPKSLNPGNSRTGGANNGRKAGPKQDGKTMM